MHLDRQHVRVLVASFLRILGKPFVGLLFACLTLLYYLVAALERLISRLRPQHPKYWLKSAGFTIFTIRGRISRFRLRRFRLILPRIRLPALPLPRFRLPLLPRLRPAFTLFILSLACLSLLAYAYIFQGLPHPKQLIEVRPPVTTKIYARDGRLLYQFYGDQNRSIVSLSDLPPYVIDATLAIEDSEFYQHAGFSLRGISRAFRRNLESDSLQGGSTITQQLVKSTLLTSEKTYQRKLKEIVLAIAVEVYFTKEEILSMYFNQIPYGGLNYGIEAAAQAYFGKSVKDVSLAEAALLAGLPAAPTVYSPFGADPNRAFNRQKLVLNRMVAEGFITQSQAEEAASTSLTFASPGQNILAPHFVMYVKDVISERYGEAALTRSGLSVKTSIDLDIQALAQYAIDQELDKLKSLNVGNAAAMVTSPKTGEVLAMVGSHDYFDTQGDGQVNVTLRPRQPGSSIKVITYALALENGFTPATIIDDAPVTYQIKGSQPYSPKNYDGRFHGRVTLRQALANSYNIPAVKTLAALGVSKMVNKARDMGITTWNDDSRFGLALTLGGGEVTMADMAVVFGVFANQGRKVSLHPILQVTDFTDSLNDTYACGQKPATASKAIVHAADADCGEIQALRPEVASLMSDILSDNQARTQAFGRRSLLEIPGHQVAVKTGTTNNLRDNWTIGYTQDYLVAVWVGNNDNTPMSRVASGVTGATPIWNTIMTALLKDQAQTTFLRNDGLVEAVICPLTGTLTCAACPNPRTEVFTKETVPAIACSDVQLAPYLSPSPAPTHSTTNISPRQPLPLPTFSVPEFTSPFSGRSKPSRPARPQR